MVRTNKGRRGGGADDRERCVEGSGAGGAGNESLNKLFGIVKRGVLTDPRKYRGSLLLLLDRRETAIECGQGGAAVTQTMSVCVSGAAYYMYVAANYTQRHIICSGILE